MYRLRAAVARVGYRSGDDVGVGVLAFALLFGCSGWWAAPPAERAAPNGPPDPNTPDVLVIVVDDLGAYEIGAYGQPDALPTPNIDRLAAEGVRFDRAWSSPLCGPARATILTGRHPHHTGHGTNIRLIDEQSWFPDSEVTFAEWLAGAPTPFHAAAVGKWHLATWGEGGGDRVLAQGFSAYKGALGNLYQDQTQDGQPTSYTNWEKFDGVGLRRHKGYITVDEADDAIRYAETLPHPWLLYVAFHATHEPHDPPPRNLKVTPSGIPGTRGAFADMLNVLDAQVGRLVAAVPKSAHVVFLADNGDDENVRPSGHGAHHVKGTMFEGGIRVPLIIRSPAVTQPGSVSRALVDVADIFPTVAELGGRPAEGVDGRSLVPFLTDPGATDDATAFVERRQPNGQGPAFEVWDRAVRDDRYKLIRALNKPDRLFDLGDSMVDGPEQLQGEPGPEVVAAYQKLVAALVAEGAGG